MPGASRSQSQGRSRSVSSIQASSMESRENFDTIVNNLLDQQFAAQEQYSTRGKYDGQILNALFGLYNHDTRRVKTKREDSLQELLTAYKDWETSKKVLLKISFRSEPGIDTGGLARNFSVWFTCRWWREQILFLLSLRVRAPGHLLLPLVSRYLDYLMLLVSKIIAQGVCQRGVGPSFKKFNYAHEKSNTYFTF